MKYYLAVDIGASSGRHILAHLEDGKIVLEEMYRFTNGNVTRDGHLCWELDRLFEEIVNGIAACAPLTPQFYHARMRRAQIQAALPPLSFPW